MLKITNLHASVADKPILNGLSLHGGCGVRCGCGQSREEARPDIIDYVADAFAGTPAPTGTAGYL